MAQRTTDTHADNDSINYISIIQRGNCKAIISSPVKFLLPVVRIPTPRVVLPAAPARNPWIKVHGNILYNVNYYSNIDTPYAEKDVYQHTVQTYLDIVVKDKYPMRIYLTNRFSNSTMFRNLNDLNFSYTNTAFTKLLREKIQQQFMASLPTPKFADSLQQLLNKKIVQLNQLETWLKNPALLQRMVEAKEKALRQARNRVDSLAPALNIDSLELMQEFHAKRQQADSLKRSALKLQQRVEETYQKTRIDAQQLRQQIAGITNADSLEALLYQLRIPDTLLPKGYRTLMAIRSLSLGRSVVNYSELSAKNISVNGIQAEYNPGSYFALAAGKVDYRFRDFIVRSPRQQDQYLTVLRYGKGLKEGNNIIFTWFAGKRQLYNAGTTDTATGIRPSQGLMGFTIEGNYRITPNVLLTGELAKSTIPSYSPAGDKGFTSSLLQMNDRTNEAYALKLFSYFPRTSTRINGSFKQLGANFQSFSTFTDGTRQTAWSAQLSQAFFKRQLEISLGANTNDFSNPFLGSHYKSTTVFKSLQATLRKRKWPVVSVGYYPSSQAIKLGEGQYQENLFYTLAGNITHSYQLQRVMMSSALIYTQFYNHSNDSGFVYFNARNLMLNHSVFLGPLTLQANANAAANTDYTLYMLESKALYALNRFITVGGGVKYNYQTEYAVRQWGYSADLLLQLPKLGQIQCSADKGYMPGMNKQLIANNTGRLTYFKTF